MLKLKKLCKEYGIKNEDVVRRWAANSELDLESIVMDCARLEKMRFTKDDKGTLEAIQSGEIVGCGEEFDNDYLRMLEDEFGSKDSTESAGYRFLKEVGAA